MLTFNYAVNGVTQFLCSLNKTNNLFYSLFNAAVRNKNHTCYRGLHTTNNPWKVLFFGTDEFAVESLKTLHRKYDSKVLQRLEVVTTNLKNTQNAVMKYAKQNQIIVKEWPLKIDKYEFDIGIVVSFGHLIPPNIINAFPLGMLNVHGSLLPRWRGAAPIVYTLMNGDTQTGVTVMKIMPKKFDIGEIILQRQIDIDEHETMPELYTKLSKLGAKLIGETFENLPELLQAGKPQDETNVTYAPKITSKISLINWNEMSASNVYNLYRALLGLYPLTTSYQSMKIKLFDIRPVKAESVISQVKGDIPGAVVYDKEKDVLIIKCKEDSFVSVKKITVQGKRCMSARDFYNGFMSGQNRTKIFFA